MSNQSKTNTGGISVFGLLGIIFVTLKLLGVSQVATWSWWWVTAPFWGMTAFILLILIVTGLFAFLKAVMK